MSNSNPGGGIPRTDEESSQSYFSLSKHPAADPERSLRC